MLDDILTVEHKLTGLVESLPRRIVDLLPGVFNVLHDPAQAPAPVPPAVEVAPAFVPPVVAPVPPAADPAAVAAPATEEAK